MIPEELIVLLVGTLAGFLLKWLTGRSYRVRIEAERNGAILEGVNKDVLRLHAEERERDRIDELLAFKMAQSVGDNRPLMSSMIQKLQQQRANEGTKQEEELNKDLGPQEAVPMSLGGTMGDSTPLPGMDAETAKAYQKLRQPNKV
jgi:hypothetical protein